MVTHAGALPALPLPLPSPPPALYGESLGNPPTHPRRACAGPQCHAHHSNQLDYSIHTAVQSMLTFPKLEASKASFQKSSGAAAGLSNTLKSHSHPLSSCFLLSDRCAVSLVTHGGRDSCCTAPTADLKECKGTWLCLLLMAMLPGSCQNGAVLCTTDIVTKRGIRKLYVNYSDRPG